MPKVEPVGPQSRSIGLSRREAQKAPWQNISSVGKERKVDVFEASSSDEGR